MKTWKQIAAAQREQFLRMGFYEIEPGRWMPEVRLAAEINRLKKELTRATDTLRLACFTDHGGVLWVPPLGKSTALTAINEQRWNKILHVLGREDFVEEFIAAGEGRGLDQLEEEQHAALVRQIITEIVDKHIAKDMENGA